MLKQTNVLAYFCQKVNDEAKKSLKSLTSGGETRQTSIRRRKPSQGGHPWARQAHVHASDPGEIVLQMIIDKH